MATETSHRVVIVGCGFAGLSATYALRRAPVTVTIIDDEFSALTAYSNDNEQNVERLTHVCITAEPSAATW